MTIYNDTLIFDCETHTYGKPDSSRDELRIFGCYSYKTGKVYLLRQKADIQKIINAHKYLVGFNNIGTRNEPGYDNPILEREGIKLKYKIIMDLKNIIKSRASQMKIKKGLLNDLLMEYSLDYITKMLDVVDDKTSKMDIDYKLFQKEKWTADEMKLICEYTKRDVLITKKLYEWIEDFFSGLKPFLNDEDVRKKIYLTSSIAKFGYKAICKAMDWEEKYNKEGSSGDRIGGGYVSYPAGEKFSGNIYLLDFNSLYPHIILMCNLHGRNKDLDDRDKWNGGDKWKIEGAYYSDELSKMAKLIKKWYSDRLELKKLKDRREYTIKIILNAALYGLFNNAYYENLFDRVAGGDCTRLERQWIKYARKRFSEEGYSSLYSDTDSCFLLDGYNDKEKLLKLKDKIIKEILATVPFPQDTFDMELEAEIKYMYFFKGKNKDDKDTDSEMDEEDFINKPKGLMKKNYIYVKKVFEEDDKGNMVYKGKDEVVIKNLGIKKKSISPLSKKIFWEYLLPKIKDGQIKFSKTYLRNLIMELLEGDVTLASMRKEVGNYDQYAETSPNSMPAQIARKYGSGIHFLIPNTRGIGVGKGKKLCTLDEFKDNKLRVEHINLDNVWKELDYFIKPIITKNIFDFGGK